MRPSGELGLIEFFPKVMSLADAFKCLFENTLDAIYILDTHGRFVAVNHKAEELTGFKRENYVGKSFRNIIPARSLPKAIRGFLSVIRGKPIRLELELKTADKKTVLVEITSTPFISNGKIVGALGIARDLTERKKAEKALQKSEERFRSLMEEAPISICNTDIKGKITYVNKAFEEATGYSREEIVGKNGFKLGIMSDETLKLLAKRMKKRLMGNPSRLLEGRFKRKDGEWIWAEIEGRLIKKFGVPVGFQLTARDITERKIAERAIRESHEKFERLFMDNPEAALYLDPDFHILDANPRFSELFGYSLDEIKGKHINDVIVLKEKAEEARMLDRKALQGYVNYETVNKRRDGSLVPVSISAAPITVEGKIIGIVALYRDITERKQMEKKLEEYSQQLEELIEKKTSQLKEAQNQLLKSERLAAIGELAAMVGHDLRNPLTGIDGATYYLKTKFGSEMDEKTREMFEIIEKDIEYSNNIITDLLEYSREIRLEMAETNPKSIMKETLSMIKVPENIQVLDFTQSEPKIEVDAERIQRVFVNIIQNAFDSMPEGGKLTIKSHEVDGSLEIAFQDTGTGMPRGVLKKIWTPLFTTKAKGMGLGLSICKRFVEAHGGRISVKSKVGVGTTFRVTLPVRTELEGGEKPWLRAPESLLLTTTKA